MPPPPPPPPPPPHRSPPPTPPRPQRGYPHNFIWHDRPFVSWPEQISQLATHRANEGSTSTSTTLHNEQRPGSRASASTEQQQQPPAPASSHNQRQNCRRYSWSAEEERLLLASVQQRGTSRQWGLIAADVNGSGGPFRSIQATKSKYHELMTSSVSDSAVGSHPTTRVDSRYQTQSGLVTPDGPTTTDFALFPRSLGYRWTPAQDALLLTSVEQHGQDWEVAAARVNAGGGPLRTGVAARVRYFKITTSSPSEADAVSGTSAPSTSSSAVGTTSSTSALAAPSESSTPRPATSQTQQALPIEALLANPAGPSTTQAAPRGDRQAKQP